MIHTWKASPALPKPDTLNKIKPVKSDAEDLISKLGSVSSSSECDPERKRGINLILGAIGDGVSRLLCIDEDLESITKSINTDDVDAVNDSLDDLASLMACNQDPQLVNTIAYGSDRLGSLQHSDEYRNTSTISYSALSRSFYICAILISVGWLP